MNFILTDSPNKQSSTPKQKAKPTSTSSSIGHQLVKTINK